MTYNILTLRTAEFDDGALYPVLGDERNEIEFESWDGADVKTLHATSLTVSRAIGSSLSREVGISDIKASVFVTDARVAVACTKYDKGGGWRGASLAVPVLNLASMARAAARRRGKMLVGHVRYPWLKAVGFTEKTGMTSSDGLRLVTVHKVDGNERTLYFDLGFPKGTDTAKLAHLISQRAARYRLGSGEPLKDEARVKFEELVSGHPLRGEPKKYVHYSMPTYFFVAAGNAYPKVPASIEPSPVAPPVTEPPPAIPPHVEPTPPVSPFIEQATPPVAPPADPVAPAHDHEFVAPIDEPNTAPAATGATWAVDPYGRHDIRFWDGSNWTEHVADGDVVSADPWPPS